MKKTFIYLIFISYSCLFSQSLSVFDVDTTNFPVMKAKFFALDKEGSQIFNLSKSDFEIKENGISKKVLNVSCPEPKPPVALSSVLVMDVSSSMIGYSIEMAKEGARAWIKGLPTGLSECAITSFDTKNYFVQDFTTDKKKLESKILDVYKGGGTDYNAAFTSPMAGGILVAKTGKYKKVVIILSDGQPNFEPNTQEIINQALQNGITVYTVTLGFKCPQCLMDITEKTGGQWFEYITTKEQARQVYQKILQTVQGGVPCNIEWKSDLSCVKGITNVEFRILNMNLSEETNFEIPNKAIAQLEFSPLSVTFKNVPAGIRKDTNIILIARNTDFIVSDIISSNSIFDINPKTFILKKDESKLLTLSYTPVDSIYSYSRFDFETDLCPVSYYSSSTNKKYRIHPSTLKLRHPNGGEYFIVGSDTIITWEGIPETELVNLEFSIDNGLTWNTIVNKTSGLQYQWKNVPKPASNKCLVRVCQEDLDDNNNSILAPKIVWQKTLGGSYFDLARSLIENNDSEYIVTGYSSSTNGDVTGNKGLKDIWVVKLNAETGSYIWQKTLGGKFEDISNSLIKSRDDLYVIAGSTQSDDGDVIGYKGAGDIWIVKLNPGDGSITWQKTLGGSGWDEATSIIECRDGSYIVLGYTGSSDGDVTNFRGGTDIWVVKLKSDDGSIIWQKTLGGSSGDVASSIIEDRDGSYVLAGFTNSIDGDVKWNKGRYDLWLVKLNPDNGSIVFQKTLGGSYDDIGNSIIESSDGSYVVAGYSMSSDGDVSGNKGWYDYWLVKLNTDDGSIIWQNTLGGSDRDEAYSLIESSDGSYIVTGKASSRDGDLIENKGLDDIWIVKINPVDGSIIWQKNLGGRSIDVAYSLIESSDGSFVVAGYSESNDGDITGNKGRSDFWIVKLQESSILQSDVSDSVFAIVEPSAQSKDIDMKQCLVGDFKDSVITAFITNTGSWKIRIDSINIEGADKDKFYLVSRITPFTLEAGETKAAEFSFQPKSVGIKTADIKIVTQSDTITQKIRGEGVQPTLNLMTDLIDFGKVEVLNRKDTLVYLLENISSSPVVIASVTQLGPDKIQFEILNNSGFTLQPGEKREMQLAFKPRYIGRTSGQIAFNFNGTGSPAVAQLFGTGIGGLVYIADDSAYIGEHRNLRLILDNVKPDGLQGIADKIKARIRFESSILAPNNNSGFNVINDSTYLNIESKIGNTSILAEIPVTAGLGGVSETSIDIEEFYFIDAGGNIVVMDVEKQSGTFRLLGICPDGGNRLINPSGSAQILSIKPNPSSELVDIEVELIESGYTKIYISDILGREKIYILDEANSSYGIKHLQADVSALGSGVYYVILKTATVNHSLPLIISD